MTHTATGHRRPRAAVALIAVPLLAALVLTLFAWPSARLAPRDLPVGVSGPAAAADDDLLPSGAFDAHPYPSAAAARKAIRDREVYGAFVATADGPRVLTASAASPVVAQQLTHVAQDRGAAVEDVAPASPSGFALGASVLPLVLAGIVCGVVAIGLGLGPLRRAAFVTGAAALVGLGGAAIVHSWLDVVGGDWLANAAALGLVVLAIAAVVAGGEALAGRAGAAIAALTMVLIGNPFSGAGSAPELLPQPLGLIGQLLPPGAGANLLRSTGYFDGSGGGGHALVLAAWALAGLAALGVAALRPRLRRPRAAPARAAA
jgi:hypothetical protein